MSIPIPPRADYDAVALRRAAKGTKHASQGRRLPALAEIYDAGTRTDAARVGGVGPSNNSSSAMATLRSAGTSGPSMLPATR